MNLKNGGLTTLGMGSPVSQNQKQDTLSNQVRMLTQSEIELLQKDKKDALSEIYNLFDKMDIRAKIAEKMTT